MKLEKHINDLTNYPKKTMHHLYSKNRDETLGKMLTRRNHLLISFFERIQPDPVELYGKAESPMIVLNRKIKLNAFVKNFQLHFTNGYHMNSEVIYSLTINATATLPNFTVNDFVNDYEHEEWGNVVKRLLGKKVALENKIRN